MLRKTLEEHSLIFRQTNDGSPNNLYVRCFCKQNETVEDQDSGQTGCDNTSLQNDDSNPLLIMSSEVTHFLCICACAF